MMNVIANLKRKTAVVPRKRCTYVYIRIIYVRSLYTGTAVPGMAYARTAAIVYSYDMVYTIVWATIRVFPRADGQTPVAPVDYYSGSPRMLLIILIVGILMINSRLPRWTGGSPRMLLRSVGP